MKYKNIMELVKRENADSLNNRIEAIKAQSPEWVIRDNLTPYRWKQYKDGSITPEKAVEIATARATAKAEKELNKKLSRLESIEAAATVTGLEIHIEWKRSRTWGANPTATVYADTDAGYVTTTGHASGCGYDKESAAIADALNQIPGIAKMLCNKKESALEAGQSASGKWNDSNAKMIAYGAGYGAIPYMEGGVGTSAHIAVFKACGIACELERHHKNSAFYIFKAEPVQETATETTTETEPETAGSLDTIRGRMIDGFNGIAAAATNTETAPEVVTA